ncbi:MAG: rubredoxin [Spirochaetia bacterium]|jgi:rubredoxin|nr:rubredoxin [Spirochaetia bacterium]
MDKHTCSVCGYVYDPQKGDSEGDVKAGTSFQDIPGTWECPICGAGKNAFKITE